MTGAALFATLVCMKHLFAVAGPLFFVVLLRNHCWGPHGVSRFLGFGFTVLSVAGIAFGPFAYFGQVKILSTCLRNGRQKQKHFVILFTFKSLPILVRIRKNNHYLSPHSYHFCYAPHHLKARKPTYDIMS